LTSEQAAEFKREATERYAEYISQLDAPDLRGSDLRNARMSGTFLPGANLRKVEMQGANLRKLHALGWQVGILDPGTGADFNDILQERAAA
jgi:uncharacterized protein YjbI with pentapeptide repeats